MEDPEQVLTFHISKIRRHPNMALAVESQDEERWGEGDGGTEATHQAQTPMVNRRARSA
jgi:hypothetical protein